ncbi:hypothetical protein EXIGLDRAFT_676096, partial [Exidia glandulosa HHB12029]
MSPPLAMSMLSSIPSIRAARWCGGSVFQAFAAFSTGPTLLKAKKASGSSDAGAKGTQSRGPIETFFRKTYPDFDYKWERGAVKEWRRLCETVLRLDPNDKKNEVVKKSWRGLQTAMVRQFNRRYGTDDQSLDAWQGLCMRLDISVPDSVKACRKLVDQTHVNLVDLTEAKDGAPPEKFDSEAALSVYTRTTEQFFPREHAEAKPLLRALLRHINNPNASHRGRRECKPKRGKKSDLALFD